MVVGQGPAGLPLAMRAVEAGFRVVGLDEDGWRVKRLNAGEPCAEGVGADALAAAHASGRYAASADADDATGFDVCVLTPPVRMRGGAPDLGPLGSAVRRIAPFLRPGATVVLEGTAYPGTTEEFVRPLLEQGSGLRAGRTSIWATARTGPSRATRAGGSATPPRSSRASTRPRCGR